MTPRNERLFQKYFDDDWHTVINELEILGFKTTGNKNIKKFYIVYFLYFIYYFRYIYYQKYSYKSI